MLHHARGEAPDQGDEQQRVDRGEPDTAEDVVHLQFVEQLTEEAVVGDVLLGLLLVEVALWQQCAGYRGQGEQEQQGQRGAHGCQRAPEIACGPQEVALDRAGRRHLARLRCPGGGGGHIGSTVSVTNMSRTQTMN